jgi:hypothetical protein
MSAQLDDYRTLWSGSLAVTRLCHEVPSLKLWDEPYPAVAKVKTGANGPHRLKALVRSIQVCDGPTTKIRPTTGSSSPRPPISPTVTDTNMFSDPRPRREPQRTVVRLAVEAETLRREPEHNHA